ncbi:MAG: hypothetical protein K0S56_2924 [Microvirga sp.]|nr:hypothetical protein [Microvirga sp.]
MLEKVRPPKRVSGLSQKQDNVILPSRIGVLF